MTAMPQQLASAFANSCAAHGLDICIAFPTGLFNATATEEERIPTFGRQEALAVLVGNSRRLWPMFKAALAREAARLDEGNPLDRYVTESVNAAAAAAAAQLDGGARHQVLFGHTMQPRPIAIQKMAREAGLAALSPSHLSVHPVFGPWIALRAVAVFDVEAAPSPPQAVTEPCASCEQPCLAALEKALGSAGAQPPEKISIDEQSWKKWLAVRDACPVGRAHRYSADQITYHYTKNPTALVRPGR